ncbi:MAG: diadenylate cyclase CdaA [Christensenellales bacterium]
MADIIGFLRDTLEQFNFLDVIDIIIVAVLIYRLILLTSETRAIQVLKGIAIILVTSRIVDWINLQAVKWIMDYIIGAGAIVLVILFQPELRNVLEQLGRSRLFNKSKRGEERNGGKAADAVCSALLNMSRRRVGALIIIERNTKLSDYADTGTRLDSLVSDSLLENIFEPNTPLHDGAVILRGERILAAGCYLPLSANQAISKALGTRHRAALGISEISDSITFVVSEETSNISIARGGKLTRNLDETMIREILTEVYDWGSTKESLLFKLKRRATDD